MNRLQHMCTVLTWLALLLVGCDDRTDPSNPAEGPGWTPTYQPTLRDDFPATFVEALNTCSNADYWPKEWLVDIDWFTDYDFAFDEVSFESLDIENRNTNRADFDSDGVFFDFISVPTDGLWDILFDCEGHLSASAIVLTCEGDEGSVCSVELERE